MLTHCGTKEIKTERLRLRALREEDAEKIYENWTSSETVAKYTTWYAHGSVEDTKAFVGYMMSQNTVSDYNWIIESETDIVGQINVCAIDEATDVMGIAYVLGEKFWGKGYMTEAVNAVVKFLFHEVNCNKIIAGCDCENIGSARVLEKTGFTREGVLRQQIRRKDGSLGDDYAYGVLRCEKK